MLKLPLLAGDGGGLRRQPLNGDGHCLIGRRAGSVGLHANGSGQSDRSGSVGDGLRADSKKQV